MPLKLNFVIFFSLSMEVMLLQEGGLSSVQDLDFLVHMTDFFQWNPSEPEICSGKNQLSASDTSALDCSSVELNSERLYIC